MNFFDISVIIPTYNDSINLKEVLASLINQTQLPKKIIVVDSSDDDQIFSLIKNYNNLKISLLYKKIDKAYAGKSTNYGIKFSDTEYIAFLDTKTVPNKNWLLKYKNEIEKSDIDVIFGVTRFESKNYFQELIRAASFGSIGHESVPGTIIKKSCLLSIGGFYENLRAAYDIEWRARVKKTLNYYTPTYSEISYSSLPNNLLEALKKYLIYSFHSAKVEVQMYIKSTYLSLFLILTAIIIPKWNHLIGNWEQNPLYIPYITRIYIISLLVILFVNLLFNNFISRKLPSSFFSNTIKILVFIFIFLGVYRWNAVIAEWVEDTVWYIPHITKIFLSLVIIISLFYRGIVFPLNRKVSKKFLFPYNFLNVSLLGLFLDLIKAPGYLFGAVISFFKFPLFGFKKTTIPFIIDKKRIVFYTKYKSESASIRYRFNAYENILKVNNYAIIRRSLFDNKFFKNKIYYNKINFLKVFIAYANRFYDITFRKKPFIAVIHIELFPFLPNIGEFILKIRKIPFVIDIDDAVYHRFEQNRNFFLNDIIIKKFKNLISLSSAMFAGNNYHINFFKNYNKNLYYFPTVINTKKYFDKKSKNKYNVFTIVWIGSPSTANYLFSILPALRRLKKDYNINIILIGTGGVSLPNLDYQEIEWSEKTEIDYISKSHVGIMPLENYKWELGKCGFKILQYMACGIPVVASPVGVNNEIIDDNINGLLASSLDDWYNKIVTLKEDQVFSEKIIVEAYKKISKDFDIRKWEKIYINKINYIYNHFY